MRRPSLQFYPGDWQANPKLRRCSHAEKGIWLDVICILHDQDEYGVIRWPLKDLALAVHAKPAALQKLVDKGVLKGTDSGECEPFIYVPRHARKDGEPVTLISKQVGPIWYSSRMVRDEYVRNTAGASTRFTTSEQPQEPQRRKSAAAGSERAQLRQSVFDKTGGYCFHCKTALYDDWEIDHFIPRSKGGSNAFSNLVPACKTCNQDKCDTLPSDWVAPARAQGARSGSHPSRAGASTSSSSSTPSSKEKKEVRADKPRDPRVDHPAIQAVWKTRGKYPLKDLWDLIIETVGDDPDAERMRDCWVKWRGRGFSSENYGWLTDWYMNGVSDGTNKPNGNQTATERRDADFRGYASVVSELRSRSSGAVDETVRRKPVSS